MFDAYKEKPRYTLDCFQALMKLTFLDTGLAIEAYVGTRKRPTGEQQDAIRESSTSTPFPV
jgi:hypothetical protein